MRRDDLCANALGGWGLYLALLRLTRRGHQAIAEYIVSRHDVERRHSTPGQVSPMQYEVQLRQLPEHPARAGVNVTAG